MTRLEQGEAAASDHRFPCMAAMAAMHRRGPIRQRR
jgi:hypothetical protein